MNEKNILCRKKILRYAFAVILIFFIVAAVSGCQLFHQPSPYEFINGWQAEIARAIEPQTKRRAETSAASGYGLYLLTRSAGVDFSSGRINVEALQDLQKTTRKKSATGHSWLILESPIKRIECGHTLQDYKRVRKYFKGVLRKAEQGDQNPASYVWTDLPGGRRHGRIYHIKPSFVMYLPLTKSQHNEISAYIDNYDFGYFSLLNHECTHFVVGAARLAGITVANEVLLSVPAKINYKGKEIKLWQDTRFSRFKLASPDVLEEGLKQLVRNGIGEDATKWFRKGRSKAAE